ncbi:scarecrow-like protein 18 [Aristolochia californica]|uniref:scarecrow-like protein 18 n=1 Tax=Aristolochia californica TaxID=171875 RepID=UPI0035D9A41E
MLGSLNPHEEEEDPDHQHLRQRAHGFVPPANHMRQLLNSCAELISQSDYAAAARVISLLSSSSTPCGDSTDRLVHQFARALSLRLNRFTFRNLLSSSSSTSSSSLSVTDIEALQTSYLYLNQITPFIRFCHLTANQAILEAIDGHQTIHILDLDTMQGVQWPPLMQAIAERGEPSNPPPSIRITGVGHDLETLRRTGDRLQIFAQSLGLNFQFHPLHLHTENLHIHLPSAVTILPGEALAVNCVLYLHELLRDDTGDVLLFLRAIKAMNPKVVTVAEREANHNHPIFLQRFMEALEHYSAIFDSLEATLPPTSRERLSVEQIWFGREVIDIIAAEGNERREKHERFERWAEILRSSGFSNVPLSPFALSQAKLLLRLHYPSEGYQLHLLSDSLFLGWQNKALFSVSSWN